MSKRGSGCGKAAKVLIGIPTPNGEKALDYVRALEAADAAVVLIPLLSAEDSLKRIYALLDGLLLSGGPDINPKEYGEEPHSTVAHVDCTRDWVERHLACWALKDNLPILGICRGIQLLNVAAGGSLVQNIPSQVSGDIVHKNSRPQAHTVEVLPNSVLAGIFGPGRIEVNSRHHQAVKTVAPGFCPTAHAPDGVIEAIESPDHHFTLGVQWHPESIWEHDKLMLELFRTFVRAAGHQKSCCN